MDKKDLKDRVIYIDIETSLNLGWFHSLGKQYVGHYQIEKDKKVCVFGYMVEGHNTVHHLEWDSRQDDTKLLEEVSKLLSKFDLIVAQNGDRFDLPVLQSRALLQKTTPLPLITTLDTLKMTRSSMKLNSHKLDYLSKALGLGGKESTDFQLWVDVTKGDKKALSKMVSYCKKDVRDLRDIFWAILPYCKLPHNLGKLVNETTSDACPECGSTHTQKRGKIVNRGSVQQRLQCTDCARWFRLPFNKCK